MSSSKTANALTKEILLAIPESIPGARAWRNNTGSAVPYAAIQAAIRLLVAGRVEECLQHLRHQRPITFGIAGQADITGILPPNGRRLEIEVKADGDRHREAQQVFGSMVQRCGGVYVVARSVDEVFDGLKGAVMTAQDWNGLASRISDATPEEIRAARRKQK